MKQLRVKKAWLFSVGQFGWALPTALVTSWFLYFYQPGIAAIAQGQTLFVPQGPSVLGVVSIAGLLIALGMVADAVSDPIIAARSDRCRSSRGRRTSYLLWSPAPICLLAVAVFWAPVDGTSWVNAVFLGVCVVAFFVVMTFYQGPYHALIPELSSSKAMQVTLATSTAVAYFLASVVAYCAPLVWGALEGELGRVVAIRATVAGLVLVSFACMELAACAVRERDYVRSAPTSDGALRSFKGVFKNRAFRCLVGADVCYWMGNTVSRSGLPFFLTTLLLLPETAVSAVLVATSVITVALYPLTHKLAKSLGSKRLLMAGHVLFGLYLAVIALWGLVDVPVFVQLGVCMALSAPAMALFGVVRQTSLTDVTRADAALSGEHREGMLYAARTFAYKIGRAASMLLFSSMAALASAGAWGYRLAAVLAALVCLAGIVFLVRYDEKATRARAYAEDVAAAR